MCLFLKKREKIGGEQEEEKGERERGEERRKEGKKIEEWREGRRETSRQ